MNSNQTSNCPWQECFDESTGFPYYWNIETNSVTWEMPEEYKSSTLDNHKITQIPNNALIKTAAPTKPRIISTPPRVVYRVKNQKEDSIKTKKLRHRNSDSDDEKIELITSYGEESESEEENLKDQTKTNPLNNVNRNIPISDPVIANVPIGPTRIYRIQPEIQVIYPPKIKPEPEILDYNLKPPPVDLQKVVEKLQKETTTTLATKQPSSPNEQKSVIDTGQDSILLKKNRPVQDIIAQIEQEQPPDLQQPSKELPQVQIKKKRPLFSLVAGYGDDSDPEYESDTDTENAPPDVKDNLSEPPVATLFPIPLDVATPAESKPTTETAESELLEPKQNYINQEATEEIVDAKAFKRKRRIALDILPTKQKKVETISLGGTYSDHIETERTGFGFQTNKDEVTPNNDRAKYKTGGISFIKAETINVSPEDSLPKLEESKQEDNVVEKDKNLDDMGELVWEKVKFLGEGKEPVSAVQIMIIQLETLIEARKENGLSNKYFRWWLNKTASELTNLEREATPIGWTCQWDRSHKRYFYRNQQTGHTQWEYPDMGIVGGAEAMDICTTPPPPVDDDGAASKLHTNGQVEPADGPQPPKTPYVPQPPPPPQITERIPTPPPPPTITAVTNSAFVPPLPPEHEKLETTQPLPPGIDSQELPYVIAKPNEAENKIESNFNGNSLGMELESFYSDIAMLDAGTNTPESALPSTTAEVPEIIKITSSSSNLNEELQVKKKKKSKASKMSSGLTLKKKGVSLLVEKWKKVQNDF